MNFRVRIAPLTLAAVAALVLAGCVNAAGAGAGVSAAVFLIALLGLGVAACTGDSAEKDSQWSIGEDAENDTDEPTDATGADADADGRWEACCTNGQVDSCFCPAGVACNYGWFNDCGDGTCVGAGQECPHDGGDTDTSDVDTNDADEVADADATDDADTTDPADATDTSEAGDADADADGRWETCCVNGEVDTCFCPSGVACNYGWFNDCGDGTCVGAGQECPHDADAGS